MKVLVSLTDQVRAIFLESQTILEKGIEKFNTTVSDSIRSLRTFSVTLSDANITNVSPMNVFRIKSELQKIECTKYRVRKFLAEFNTALHWIHDVTSDVASMASLDQEDVKEYSWKFSFCTSNAMARLMCCVKPLDPFFDASYDAIRLRVCLTKELMDALYVIKGKSRTIASSLAFD